MRSGWWITRRQLRIAAVVCVALLAAAVGVAVIAQRAGHLTTALANAIGVLFLLIAVVCSVVGLLLRIWVGADDGDGAGGGDAGDRPTASVLLRGSVGHVELRVRPTE